MQTGRMYAETSGVRLALGGIGGKHRISSRRDRFFYAPGSAALVLLSKSSKSLDHMLRKEYTVYCFEILWIGHMLRYHTDGFSESPTTVSLLLC